MKINTIFKLPGNNTKYLLYRGHKINKFYDSVFPSSFIHHKYEPEILARLLDRQERIMKKNIQPIKDHSKLFKQQKII